MLLQSLRVHSGWHPRSFFNFVFFTYFMCISHIFIYIFIYVHTFIFMSCVMKHKTADPRWEILCLKMSDCLFVYCAACWRWSGPLLFCRVNLSTHSHKGGVVQETKIFSQLWKAKQTFLLLLWCNKIPEYYYISAVQNVLHCEKRLPLADVGRVLIICDLHRKQTSGRMKRLLQSSLHFTPCPSFGY